jgi:hypothetical protein
MRIVLVIVGFLTLIHAAWGKGLRWGLYEFDDESDIVPDRRTGRIVAAVIGVAFIIGSISYRGQE